MAEHLQHLQHHGYVVFQLLSAAEALAIKELVQSRLVAIIETCVAELDTLASYVLIQFAVSSQVWSRTMDLLLECSIV